MKIYKTLLFTGILSAMVSCDYVEPYPIQDQSDADLWSHANYGEGLLTRAYTGLNTVINEQMLMDTYTDNAVPATPGENAIAVGNWTVENNPIGNWTENYNNIKYINIFLEHAEDLIYSVSDPVQNDIENSQRIGEAYFLRAWYHAELLKHYAGEVDGQIMGIPIVTTPLEEAETLDLPRNTYEEVVAQIVSDCDLAIERLPLMYNNGSETFSGLANRGRGSGLGAMALKARVYLNAASPAYGPSTSDLWLRAANAAVEAMDASGGLTDLSPFGNFNDADNFENIWIQPTYIDNSLESLYYPPSLYGSGNINPSQNLVDAFPASDGYPIEDSDLYAEDTPYENRDPRFERFIFYNGDDYNGNIIETFVGGQDAPGGLNQQGTRTGYYMKKQLSMNVRLTPGDATTDEKFKVYLSRTELYLNFAEAANEALGPDDASLGYSAAQVMETIRRRAGIDSDAEVEGFQDEYLTQQSMAGTDAFRDFIHNERRIELSFEGFRFWDTRRWNDELNHTIEGVRITPAGDGEYTYNYIDVEQHQYQEYMRYVPLPFEQVLIMDNLSQNDGWN
ncbi:RagB/SusD family nutrient uptake outer membrane protein [Zunongwangia sp. SCSIO 43204]|uniref:RagB/SusD family nutrient uptake outer membrane protein n=1 Tax=Zunongwangia sp. SCSIO 43204 TaxID=2779359 RepID=UPI001CA82D92|nr:RagB/SusD family nutrient uptake outer membrane protein [Zunongwangia sp. SCSIO 43204]UAB83282.1 RagB/SusD family nutrient uptake outer membrane protein [Zunongwangia sp. SCSIO 43204]